MYALSIAMKPGRKNSTSELEISSIYIYFANGSSKNGYYFKEYVHDLINNGNVIRVNLGSYPKLQAMTHPTSEEKYVRSEPNNRTDDNLLSLPRY